MIDPENRHTPVDVLVQHYRRGDREALPALIRKFHSKLLRMIAYQLGDSRPAEDIAQDCWYAIIKQLPGLELRISFSAWAAGIARRKAIDWIRAQQRTRDRTGEVDETKVPHIEPGKPDNPDDRIDAVRMGIKQLSPTHQIVLEMFYINNLKVQEISKVLNLPVGTIKSRLFHARENLKKIIANRKES